MASSKRKTFLPYSLQQENNGNRDKQHFIEQKHPIKEEEGPLIRFGIPVNPASISIASQGFEKDSQIQYHRSYNIDQAGPGVIALKDIEGFPVCLLKQRKTCQDRVFRRLRRISHKNLVPLIDAFYSKGSVFLVYEYQHLVISLGCAIAKIRFSEADIATICKDILEGLQFIHYELNITHGSINITSILLTWKGQLKIGNIGDSIIEQKDSQGKESDVQSIGWLVIYLSDQATLLLDSDVEAADPTLSETGRVFVEKTKNSSTKELLKDDFLHMANPGGAWSLKRHYFEALPWAIRIGSHADISR